MDHEHTALVTGGSRGIGRSVVFALAARGIRVLAVGRQLDSLERLRDECPAGADGIRVRCCDIAEPEQIVELFKHARAEFPKLDLLVNNAAVSASGPADEVTAEVWDQVMDVNARGTFLCAREGFSWMKETGGGRIINISSVVGIKGYVNQVVYTASKHAVLGITKVMAREGQAHGIRVSAICPGGVNTDMVKEVRPDLDTAGLIQPEDIAAAVLYLADEPDSCCTDLLQVRRAGSLPFD